MSQEQRSEQKRLMGVWASKTPKPKDPNAVALGKLGGRRGGNARRRALTQEQRTAAARHAANCRWHPYSDEDYGNE